MNRYYTVLAYAPPGDMIRFALTCRPAGISQSVSAARRHSEHLQRKVTRIMDGPRHVTPLPEPAARSRRHRTHLTVVAAGLAAGLALLLAALVTRTEPLFWAGYGLAAATWLGGWHWCRRHRCASRSERDEP
jgi:hypothetical protein